MPERIKSWGLRISRAYASALSNTIKLDLIGKNMEARLKEIKDKSAPCHERTAFGGLFIKTKQGVWR